MEIDKERQVVDSYLLSRITNKKGELKDGLISMGFGAIIQAEYEGLNGHADAIRIRILPDAMRWYRKHNYKIPKYLIGLKELHFKELLSRAIVLAFRNITEFHVRSELYKI